jgi:osmotically-inducible protein OsmY
MKTDAQLKQDVITDLACEPSVNATRIGVEVSDGIVTLAGHVDSYAEKWHAERATQRVGGVKALAIEMDVVIPGAAVCTDTETARSAEHALQWVSYIPKDALAIKVEKDRITLSGEVEWDYQRQNAIGALRYLAGVTGVTDNTSLKVRTSGTDVRAGIEAALTRQSGTCGRDISVEVRDGDVTLTGTVQSWWARKVAHESAWSAVGVRHVIDHLNISA